MIDLIKNLRTISQMFCLEVWSDFRNTDLWMLCLRDCNEIGRKLCVAQIHKWVISLNALNELHHKWICRSNKHT